MKSSDNTKKCKCRPGTRTWCLMDLFNQNHDQDKNNKDSAKNERGSVNVSAAVACGERNEISTFEEMPLSANGHYQLTTTACNKSTGGTKHRTTGGGITQLDGNVTRSANTSHYTKVHYSDPTPCYMEFSSSTTPLTHFRTPSCSVFNFITASPNRLSLSLMQRLCHGTLNKENERERFLFEVLEAKKRLNDLTCIVLARERLFRLWRLQQLALNYAWFWLKTFTTNNDL